MKDDSQASTSIWMATANTPSQSPLKESIRTDVCIIGAGIAGLTVAYLLGREGRSVVVLDDGVIGGGMTGRTTAHLTNAYDDRYVEIEKLHGGEAARFTAESHTAAIEKINEIASRETIDCDFAWLDGFLFAATPDHLQLLEDELAAAHRAGLTSVEKVARAPLASFDTGVALRFPRQAQFHPLKYMDGLARAVIRDGGRIFGQTHATKIEGGDDAQIETSHGPVVTCEVIVVATNTPVNDRVAIHTKQAPYVTYVIGVVVPRGSVTPALYWDTGDPYHYVRLQRDNNNSHEVLIVGGEDHKTGQANDGDERFARLEQWTRERFPEIGEVQFRWSGQVMEPVDGIAFIGRNPLDDDNVYIATGDSGQGMTHGTIAGILLTDMIQGRKNKWEDLYSPSRIRLKSLPEYASENINVAGQYADYVTAGDIKSESELKPGEGAIMREGVSKVAVHRDDSGQVHKLTAICPHLGCVVAWNSTEKTWDCPCHGSRFSAEGRVYQGPANGDLSRAED
ncbi:MAG TPA: FAD-dependent oxidoreductase [Pyrinomonadaceae bacterium]|nr:FAD-dependent oxidoreductase [Pyrinomonadaceae bacterium]